MFSTSGYFRGVDCPYFSSGLCERPYCHLRHVNQDDKATAEEPTKTGDAASLLSMVGNAIKQVQKDIELDQARIETSNVGVVKTNALLQPSTSNLAEKYAINQPVIFVKNHPSKPKHRLQAPKEIIPKNKNVQYNPTPIKELEKKKKSTKFTEYDPTTNYSLFGTDPSKRKSQSDNSTSNGENKRPRRELVQPVEAQFSEEEEEDIKAPEFSDLDDSADEEKKSEQPKGVKKKGLSKSAKRSESGKNKKSNTQDDFKVFEKSGRGESKGIDIVPVQDLLGVKVKKSESPNKTTGSKKEKHSGSKEKDCIEDVPSKSNEKVSNKGKDKNIFEEFLKSDKLKEAAKQVVENGDVSRSLTTSEKNTSLTSSSKHEKSGSERSSREKDKKRRHSSSHSSDRHHSSKKRSSSEKDRKHSGSNSSTHKHSKRDKDSKSSQKDHKHSSSSSSSSSHHKEKHKRRNSSSHHRSSDKKESDKKSSSSSKGLKRQVSHADLFGEESDSEGGAVVEASGRNAVITIEDDNCDIIEIKSDRSYESDLPDLSSDDETHPQSQSQTAAKTLEQERDEDDNEKADTSLIVTSGKKRVAHAGQSNSSSRKRNHLTSANRKLSPSEVMHNRFMELQKRAAEAAQAVQEAAEDLKKTKSPIVSSSLGGNKKRSAHVVPKPFMGSENLAKKPMLAVAPKRKEPEALTLSTQRKGSARVAHVPKISALKRPTIPTEFGSKVPSNIRQRYLNQFIDECLRIYPNEKDAFDRGLAEEKAVYERSSSRVVYLNVAVNTIKRLRSEAPREPGPESDEEETKSPKVTSPIKQKASLSHMAMIGGAKAAKISYTLHRSRGVTVKIPDTFVGADLYKRMNWYVMSEDLLVSNGFPRPDPEKLGYVVINREITKNKSTNPNEKICSRCGQLFQVTEKGKYITKDACMYHWGKCWKKKIAGQVDNRWTCCQEHSSTKGCTLAPLHVFDRNRYEDLSGYVKTKPCSPPADGDFKCYALDCEMIYTTAGSELARVSVVGSDLKSVYETLVKPSHHIVDYNTRFSGLTEEEMRGVTTTLEDVQEKLLDMFSDKTILLGHSLESDLIALKIVHDTVVDTSVVFPHRLGPPYKRALQTLMAEILLRIIQNDVGGHDSIEDAASCMELMMWKLKEDAKKAARR